MKVKKERRAHKRARKIIGINILTCHFDGNMMRFEKNKRHPKFHNEIGTEFSPAGMRILCSKALPENSRIKMKLMIPDREQFITLDLTGKIVWVKETKTKYKKAFWFGVQFKSIPQEIRRRIRYLWKRYSS